MILKPQAGPQKKFLESTADIVLYGGGAGGGKTFGLLLDPIRFRDVKGFGGIIFRRVSTQVRTEGGLWDESERIYPLVGGVGAESYLKWNFPDSGVTIKFSHIQYDKDIYNYQGAQIPYIGFDELTHFSRKAFFYMMSRNRSVCGIRSYIRATCNPDADSWVADLVEWYIEQDESSPNYGLPIPERSGVVRYFVNVNDTLHWADNPFELIERFTPFEWKSDPFNNDNPCKPKSFTFIPATVFDNKLLLSKDPGYLANLNSLDRVERERLLSGNWKIRPAAGLYFRREDVEIVQAAPAEANRIVRFWDRAATEQKDNNDPDWTVGVKMSRTREGVYFIEDVIRFRASPYKVLQAIVNAASQDDKHVSIRLEQEPGASGKSEVANLIRALSGYKVKGIPAKGDKVTRAQGLSAQWEAGNVKIVKGKWNSAFLQELEEFPDGGHDDQVDAASGAFNELSSLAKPSIKS